MWQTSPQQLSTTLKFKDFAQAFAFMTEVAFHAEKQNHHPNWSNVYHTVSIQLSTHDAGNIVTEKDHRLAKTIEEIYQKYSTFAQK